MCLGLCVDIVLLAEIIDSFAASSVFCRHVDSKSFGCQLQEIVNDFDLIVAHITFANKMEQSPSLLVSAFQFESLLGKETANGEEMMYLYVVPAEEMNGFPAETLFHTRGDVQISATIQEDLNDFL